MRLAFSLNKFSIGLALLSCLSAGAASAQSLRGVNATLNHSLDSKSATAGQIVTAKINDSLKSDAGIDLPKGTELVGKVADVKASRNDGPASVTLVFTTAKLKSGKEVPVKVTLLAASSAAQADEVLGEPPATVNGDASISQGPGAINKVSLASAVKNSDSGTFTRTDGNFRLDAGTYFQLGIAPAAGAAGTSAAE